MLLRVLRTDEATISPFRALFLQEGNFQFVCHSFHERAWCDSYLLLINDTPVGYGSVSGRKRPDRDSIFEFYLLSHIRSRAAELFRALIAASQAAYIECQTNDALLFGLVLEHARHIQTGAILFEDHQVTHHVPPGVVFRTRRDTDPAGDSAYVLELGGVVVATGGFLTHYNMPFADLYMEVHEGHRRKGLGTFILQELKKETYKAGRVPCARCNVSNLPSKATLLKAGLRVCGYILTGDLCAEDDGFGQ